MINMELRIPSLGRGWDRLPQVAPKGVRRVGTSETNEGTLCPELACLAVASQPLHLSSIFLPSSHSFSERQKKPKTL